MTMGILTPTTVMVFAVVGGGDSSVGDGGGGNDVGDGDGGNGDRRGSGL